MKPCKKKNCLTICLIILLALNLLNSFRNNFVKDEYFNTINTNIKQFFTIDNQNNIVKTKPQTQPTISQAGLNISNEQVSKGQTVINNNEYSINSTISMNSTTTISKLAEKYIFKISKERINRLFRILHEKEFKYEHILNDLGLISFETIIKNPIGTKSLNVVANLTTANNTASNKVNQKNYTSEIKKYLSVDKGEIVATNQFIRYLNAKSDQHSFLKPRQNIVKAKIINDAEKPILITAANLDYFEPLQATVHYIQVHFPDHKLIVYDLGLTAEQLDLTVRNCKCIVRKFDANETYKSTSPFISFLKKFSWKPLIIQEVLKEYDTILYVDSSIRFRSAEIGSLVDSCKDVGFLTQFIGFNLVCYTTMNQFVWFGETWNNYEEFFTIEANILMFHRSFLTNLIMKAWVTCALDENCMAPVEIMPAQPCYQAHRFDQDALTIISSFFYGHPTSKKEFLPAYSFTTAESFFFEIKRYEGFKIWS